MLLKKNLWGLFFFFCWGAVFSQWKQLERINETFVEVAFVDINEKHLKSTFNLYFDDGEILKRGDEYNSLLDSLTVVEKEVGNFKLNFLNINSEHSDYAPVFFEGELVFSSSRNVSSISKSFDNQSNQPFLDLFTTSKRSDKQRIRKLKGSINTKFHESSAAFSKDNKTVYFTRNNYSKRKSKTNTKGNVLLKIYRAYYEDGKWKNVEELPFSSDEYSIAHPTLSPDGRFLYFASDMPGSIGQSDLYVVEIYDDGSFGIPQNLGEQINTEGRETFPYVSDKGKLFFASDGHIGFGGLDVFVVMPDQSNNARVYNLGVPINSTEDDFTFIINEESKIGYFASNRMGGDGDDDIYGFRQLVSFSKYFGQKPETIKEVERVIDIHSSEEKITSF
ncbi:TolB family protein [Aquimarina mytili]|uniref:PD40 domain-containing protein n=1 Tax=Aquimarina mytili TaxID=874423 RepID=A0A936ZUQ3_9FLAO|nr:PD40 domain-containing protein [Aquimarina mytili]MBL0685038.1 PD40 domain-containing protein [Aquimarina mytili]